MRKLFALLACFAMTHLSADVFENFEYHLPQEWNLAFTNKDFSEGCNIIQYIRDISVVDGTYEHMELFTIMSTNDVVNLSDTEALISEIKFAAQAWNASVNVNILETTHHSVTFGTVVTIGDQISKSLTRYILNSDKMIYASYTTNDSHQYETENLLWLHTGNKAR